MDLLVWCTRYNSLCSQSTRNRICCFFAHIYVCIFRNKFLISLNFCGMAAKLFCAKEKCISAHFHEPIGIFRLQFRYFFLNRPQKNTIKYPKKTWKKQRTQWWKTHEQEGETASTATEHNILTMSIISACEKTWETLSTRNINIPEIIK